MVAQVVTTCNDPSESYAPVANWKDVNEPTASVELINKAQRKGDRRGER